MIVIHIARKPLTTTVASNALEHGTGGLNVDGSRLAHDVETKWVKTRTSPKFTGRVWNGGARGGAQNGLASPDPRGRWPSNLILDGQHGLPDDLAAYFLDLSD